MSKPKDGGPAFPVLEYEYKATGDLHPSPTMQPGMTLRDWFAGRALTGMLANPDCGQSNEKIADWAYRIADAMLEERGKR